MEVKITIKEGITESKRQKVMKTLNKVHEIEKIEVLPIEGGVKLDSEPEVMEDEPDGLEELNVKELKSKARKIAEAVGLEISSKLSKDEFIQFIRDNS